MREKVPLPDRIRDAPQLWVGMAYAYDAFAQLNSTRPQTLDGPGDIPWTAVDAFCRSRGLGGDDREDLFYYIRAMDAAFRKYVKEKRGHG